MSPATAPAALKALRQFDVTEVLPTIRVPTLVLMPNRDPVVPLEAGRYLAAKIPNARFVETSGEHHGFMFGDVIAFAAEIERFLTGAVHDWDPDRAFATLLFTDMVASTERAAELGDKGWRELLERHETLVQERVESAGGWIVKPTGDGFLIRFERSADAIRCAETICADAEGLGIKVRAGVHSGECEQIRNDLAGLAVHIGARVGALAEPGEVLVSSTVKDLVAESGIEFAHRGAHRLKGVPGEWQLFAVKARGASREHPQLQPTARDHLTRRDRIAVRFAASAPALVRAMTRVLRWRPRPKPFGAAR
jgi:class 3 adenylate cyclase